MDGKEIVALWATTCVPNTNISPWDLGQLAILIDTAIAQAVAAEREAVVQRVTQYCAYTNRYFPDALEDTIRARTTP